MHTSDNAFYLSQAWACCAYFLLYIYEWQPNKGPLHLVQDILFISYIQLPNFTNAVVINYNFISTRLVALTLSYACDFVSICPANVVKQHTALSQIHSFHNCECKHSRKFEPDPEGIAATCPVQLARLTGLIGTNTQTSIRIRLQ